ncbi:DUF6544 family protein [Alteribacter aurantiacus]|uniref:DUF6544 family protein n=1 Tax=Alteribacter aurantiacus TaxID=254410 RepID=UPI0004286493|nr:DUF6544 family protein [Alteribacter aurantiacus]
MIEQILSDLVFSVVVIAILFLGLLLISNWVFLNRFREDVLYMREEQEEGVDTEQLALPRPLRNYLLKVNGESQERYKQCFITYEGFKRIKEGRSLNPVKGEQFYLTDRPSYMWMGFSKANPIVRVSHMEKLSKNEGRFFSRLWSIFTVKKEDGSDVVERLRYTYFSEMVWFPQSFIHYGSVQWTEVSEREVDGDFGNGMSVSLLFNDEGLIERASANRKSGEWTVHYSDYRKNQDDVVVPYRLDTYWKQKDEHEQETRVFLKTVHYE